MDYIVRNLHFVFVHIPIAMLIFSFLFDALAFVLRRKDWHTAGLLCLGVGTLGAIAAVVTGPEGGRNPLLPTHEFFGKVTMLLAIALTAVRIFLLVKKKHDAGSNTIYLAAALIGVLLVSYTGHLGGQMVHPDRSKGGPGGPGMPPGQMQNGDGQQRPGGPGQGGTNGQQQNRQQPAAPQNQSDKPAGGGSATQTSASA